MNKKDLIDFSDIMFKNINYYVIQHGFELEVYNMTNGQVNKRLVLNGDSLEIMINFITYIYGKVITQTLISLDKKITVLVRDKKELKK